MGNNVSGSFDIPGTALTATAPRFRLKAGGSTTTLIAASGIIANDQWVHAAAVYDGSAMRLYLNDTQVGAVAESGSIDSGGTVPLWIGGNPLNVSGTEKRWDGQINGVRIHEACALRRENPCAD